MSISEHGYRELLVVFIACLILVMICVRYVPVLSVVPALFFLFSLYFFRDPDRNVPDEPGVLVSPADGTVADIENVFEDQFLEEKCVRIGIFLSIFNVHVNRSPGEGRVEREVYKEGAFHNAMSEKASRENESNTVLINGPSSKFIVKQIAGLIARRIVCTKKTGDDVARGERIGMIKFGSRTELYVPRSTNPDVRVEEGDTVTGGETILFDLGGA